MSAPQDPSDARLTAPPPASLGEEGRPRPPRRRIRDGRGRWASGLAIGLALLLGLGTGLFLLHVPAPPHVRLPGGAQVAGPVGGSTAVAAVPTASPEPSGTPAAAGVASVETGAAAAAPPAQTSTPVPAPAAGGGPPAATDPPGPTVAPPPTPPPLTVLSVVVRAQGSAGCVLDQLLHLFGCDFTVLVDATGGTGQEAVQVTLTATPLLGRPVSATVAAKPGTATPVRVTFAGPCPMGTATAVTVPRSLTPAGAAPFGRC